MLHVTLYRFDSLVLRFWESDKGGGGEGGRRERHTAPSIGSLFKCLQWPDLSQELWIQPEAEQVFKPIRPNAHAHTFYCWLAFYYVTVFSICFSIYKLITFGLLQFGAAINKPAINITSLYKHIFTSFS